MMSTDLPTAAWRKSSFSGGAQQNCVEVAQTAAGTVAVRDSKDPAGPVLRFTRAEWTAFVCGVRAGEFEPPLPLGARGDIVASEDQLAAIAP